jgi:hypothetical protein
MAFTVVRAGRNVVALLGDQVFSGTRISLSLKHD